MKNQLKDMKKTTQLVLILIMVVFGLNTNMAQRSCGTHEYHEAKMQSDPVYKANYQKFEKSVKKFMDENGSSRADCSNPQFFPVAIHYDWTASAAQRAQLIILAQHQVATLNSSFNGSDCQGTTNANCFEFKLATNNHPQGSGVVEGDPAVTFGGTPGADYCPTSGGETAPCNLTRWVGYMNITVNSLSGGPECTDLGVSHLPGNPTTLNSMSVNSCAFGSVGVVTAGNVPNVQTGDPKCNCLAESVNGGTTTVHEIGHFVGLFHTFCADNGNFGAGGLDPMGDIPASGDGCQQPSVCSGGCMTTACDCDFVTDTPPQAYSNSGCVGGSANGTAPNPSQPGSSSPFNNFMDYVDDICMNCFSQGQYMRIAATLASTEAGVSNYKTKEEVCPPVEPPGGNGAGVPTLGEWGLIFLCTILVIFGVVAIRQYATGTVKIS